MPFNPSKPLWVLPIADPADPIIDTAHPECPERVAVYVRTRDPLDLGRLPRVEGQRTTLWLLKPLSSTERAVVMGEPAEERRRTLAFRIACHERVDDAGISGDGLPVGGTPVKAQAEKVDGAATSFAPESWVDAAQAIGGGQLVSELGQLIIDRANVHPRKLAPFRLPWGLAPAR